MNLTTPHEIIRSDNLVTLAMLTLRRDEELVVIVSAYAVTPILKREELFAFAIVKNEKRREEKRGK